jgi:hypothetical protein
MAELKSSENIGMQASLLMEKYVLQDMDEEVESEIARDVSSATRVALAVIQLNYMKSLNLLLGAVSSYKTLKAAEQE